MSLTRAQLRSLIEDDIIDRSDKTTLVNYAIDWGLEYIDKTTTARGYTFADLNKEEITYTTISCDFETTAVDADTDLITVSIDIPTGTKIVFTSDDTVPTGLTASTDYWAIRASSTTIYVAETYLAAWQGTYVDIEDTGSGTHTVTAYRERLAKPDSCKHIYNIRLIDGASSRSLIAMPPRRLDLFKTGYSYIPYQMTLMLSISGTTSGWMPLTRIRIPQRYRILTILLPRLLLSMYGKYSVNLNRHP